MVDVHECGGNVYNFITEYSGFAILNCEKEMHAGDNWILLHSLYMVFQKLQAKFITF